MRICPQCKKQLPDFVDYCPSDGTRLVAVDEPVQKSKREQVVLDNKTVGPYRIEDVLAEGGMGVIFSAVHLKLGRRVALKMLRPEFAGSKKAITRFFREARAVNAIRHENIIEITDFIEDEQGANYYIMELLEGRSLKALLSEYGPLPVPRVMGIALQICDALGAVHKAGIIHRDLKPDNIVLIARGDNPDFVKLLDFGVAKMVRFDDEDESAQKTIEGTILGTADYMSPEQASGKEVDHRTDIYALGVIVYEALTGQKPISGNNFREIIYNQLTVEPVPPSRLAGFDVPLPMHLEELIMQCLEKEPDRRPQSMDEVSSRLSQIGRAGSVQVETRSVEVAVAGGPRRGTRARRLRGTLLAVAVVVLVAFAVGGGLMLVSDPAHSQGRGASPGAPGANGRPVAGRPVSAGGDMTGGQAAGVYDRTGRVEVLFETVPPGARIVRKGSLLGTTPARLSFERGQVAEVFEFRMNGYAPARRRIVLDTDRKVRLRLDRRSRGGKKYRSKAQRKKAARQKAGHTKRSPPTGVTDIDLGGTVDPFGEN